MGQFYKRSPSFKSAMAKRKVILEKFKRIEVEYHLMYEKLSEIESQCHSLKSWGDKFERYLPGPSINFSGYEG